MARPEYPFPTQGWLGRSLHGIRPARKLIYNLWRLPFRLGPRRKYVTELGGVRFELDPFDHVSRKLAVWRSYESTQMCFLYDLSRDFERPVLVDVGANFGVYGLFFARDPRFREIICLEPNPRTFRQLQHHHELNGSDERFSLHELAASDRAGRIAFHSVHKRNTGASAVSIDAVPDQYETEAGEVEAVRLDDLLRRKGEQLVFKIDVQGHEENVLRGLEQTLRDNECILQVEIFSDRAERMRAMIEGFGCEFRGAVGEDFYFSTRK